ncbi:oligopeptide/dipeptide ABC transporter ATP-binding protein [Plastorhodobacter daqingensis]|uniref:Oligopeptide/dipeptide ABC transporter ATP-binding protein n=1 Tax=Plastorhodobacter daqingensis TaxID=1387281 RepID=A0ABW2UNP0_9RHOB
MIAETADRVAVMYAGRLAELGPVAAVIKDAKHPYSQGLMGAIPKLGQHLDRLVHIPGSMPRLNAIPKGCAFNPRCPKVFDKCRSHRPAASEIEPGRRAACWLYPGVTETALPAARSGCATSGSTTFRRTRCARSAAAGSA